MSSSKNIFFEAIRDIVSQYQMKEMERAMKEVKKPMQKERICKTCAWGRRSLRPTPPNVDPNLAAVYIKCCYNPFMAFKEEEDFCRHHAFTTGWENEEPTQSRAILKATLTEGEDDETIETEAETK